MPVSLAKIALHKAPGSRGEQGQEQFAHSIDCTNKNQAAEVQGSEVCSTD